MDSNSVTARPSLQRSSGRTARDRQRVARLAGHPALPADSRLSPTGRHYTVPWIESSSHLPGPAGASPPSVAADQSNLPGPAGASSPSVAADRPNLSGPAGASSPRVAADRPNLPAGLLFMDGGETIYRYLAVPDSWLVEEEDEDESQNSQDEEDDRPTAVGPARQAASNSAATDAPDSTDTAEPKRPLR